MNVMATVREEQNSLEIPQAAEGDGHALPARNARRNFLLRWLAVSGAISLQAGPLGALAQALKLDTEGRSLVRRALVLGNTAYKPERQQIPSSRKNAADVADALTELGFEVR